MADLEIFVVILEDTPASKNMFAVRAPGDISVDKWRELVHAKTKRLEGFHAADLELWKLKDSIPSVRLDTAVAAVYQNLPAHAEEMLPSKRLSHYFAAPPTEDSLHAIVELPKLSRKRARSIHEGDVASKRQRIFEEPSQAPSGVGRPEVYDKFDKENFAFNRPPSVEAIPLALLHETFGHFAENVLNYKPTKEDNALVNKLRWLMSATYSTEAVLCDGFRQTLGLHYPEIQLEAAAIGSTKYQSDGHARIGNFILSVSEGKLLGKTVGDPEVQACAYYIESMRGTYRLNGDLPDLFPCLIIYFTGPLVGFSGAVITDRVQLEVLTPVYPLHANPHESAFADQAARAFGAYRHAFQQLKAHYEQIESTEPDLGNVERVMFPYRDHYTGDDQTCVQFTYHRRLHGKKLVFIATTSAGENIIVKFTRRYSQAAHQYCSEKGIAPQFRAMNKLPGGWFMVVMDFLDTPYDLVTNRLNGKLDDALRLAVGILHDGGFVHGDIRDCNLMFSQDEKGFHVMILDFDWAGDAGDARYPAYINIDTVTRPGGAIDGELIYKDHDLFMVDQILGRRGG